MIEYLVGLACPVKEAVRPEALMRALKSRARVDAAFAAARAEGADPALTQVRLSGVDAEGGERTEVVLLGELERRTTEALAPVLPLAGHCDGCRARAARTAFGCYGTIGYPLLAATEELLMDRLPPVLGTVSGSFLVRAVRELGFDGAPVAKMRALPGVFFERERPVTQRWASERGTWEMTSDQLVHMTFFSGRSRASHALLLALVLGVVPHGISPEAIEPAVADPRTLADVMDPILLPSALMQTQLGEIARFLEAIRKAVSLGCDLVVDA
ncbi:MAG TPA: hypothetical protein VGM56_00825 [Byssovorax sp.]|jgi:hypothetical protein